MQTGNKELAEQYEQYVFEFTVEIAETLVQGPAAFDDLEFGEELEIIKQWFRVLSKTECTAALYAMLQQTTQVQMRCFSKNLENWLM